MTRTDYAKPFLCAIVVVLMLISGTIRMHAQTDRDLKNMESIIYESKQRKILSYLADEGTRGRAAGSRGNRLAGYYIIDRFKEYGLQPYNGGYYTQSFRFDSIACRNIIGMVPAKEECDEYIIVCAHYDHIGSINGYIYAGADDNASGVTALLNLAEMFSVMHKAGMGPEKNLLFAAFDAKELNMAGSQYFINTTDIPYRKIACVINLDQIGSILEPPHNEPNYLLVLGTEKYKKTDLQKLLFRNNMQHELYLDLDFTFYGSPAFYKTMYGLSDQISFAKKGIPALYFTSGFHKHTYKNTDTEEIISYPVLKKRTLTVFYLVNSLMML